MANVFIDDSILQGWADTVREKTGTTDKMLPSALLQQTQANWGTGGGSESGVLTLTAFGGFPSYDTSTTITGKIEMTVPEEAIVEHTYVNIAVIGGGTAAGSSTTLETINVGSPTTVATETPTSFNMKNVELYEYSIDNPDGLTVATRTTANFALVRLPNAYIKDNILYAKANCKALLPYTGGPAVGIDGRRDSLYFEGIDLRGSQVERLPSRFGRGHSELKKLWLSENFYLSYETTVFEFIKEQLEELHFTATTPKPVSSSYVFNGLNTACKIYVPAGTLDAYTSTRYYPSPSTYTYIEE